MLLFIETSSSGLKRSSYELITAARSIAGGAPITGVTINATAAHLASAGEYGLTDCVNIEMSAGSPFANSVLAATIAGVATELHAKTVLFAANATGKDIAPRVAIRLNAGLLADCVELQRSGDALLAKRPVFAGKAFQTVRATTATTVATLRPNVFTAKKADAPVQTAIRTLANGVAQGVRSSQVSSVSMNQGTLDVSEADVIVSGGRGLKGPEHFGLIEDLAKALGGAVGASRAVVDAGWRPHREQVGQTGKTVSPTMYVACGISGAVQHLAGMSSSKVIVAINKDKDAPIFKVADYGLVGDVFDILPKLTSKIESITGH